MGQLWMNFLGSVVSLAGAWWCLFVSWGPVWASLIVFVFVVVMVKVHPVIQARRWAEYDARVFGVDGSVSDDVVD